jgi:regulator of chromosome condensation
VESVNNSVRLLTLIVCIGLGDDQPFEIKKPRKIPFFDIGG